jgi:hypothetical protein
LTLRWTVIYLDALIRTTGGKDTITLKLSLLKVLVLRLFFLSIHVISWNQIDIVLFIQKSSFLEKPSRIKPYIQIWPQEVDDETVINIRENWRDNTETQATLGTRHRTKTNKHNVENKKKRATRTSPKTRRLTQVLVKG